VTRRPTRKARAVNQQQAEFEDQKKHNASEEAGVDKDFAWPRVQRYSRGLDDIFAPLAKVVVFGTIVVGGYQYFQAQHELRVDRSLEYVAEWNSAGYRTAFDKLNRVIWPIYSEAAAEIDALAGSPAQRNSMLANIGEQVTSPATAATREASRNADQVFSFFERATLCANEQLCDFAVLDTFLGNEVRSFWTYFSRYAALKNSTGYSTYGYWTERFATGQVANRKFLGAF
jgi:hypothetical protein